MSETRTITVEVTRRMIDECDAMDCSNCAVARGLKAVTKRPVHVGVSSFIFEDDPKLTRIPFPSGVPEFIVSVLRCKRNADPITFTLEI